jgi:hypothetical protein
VEHVKMPRIAVACALLLAAAVLAGLAADVLGWRDAIRRGDRELARAPAAATWNASTLLPADPARDLLGLDLPLRFRAAEQAFVAVRAAGQGFDNGLSETRNRGEVEAELAQLARSDDHVLASQADNLLGILAFADSSQTGASAPAPIDQSVADFQAAVRLDPGNADAKFNLELLLRQLVARGVRRGPGSGAGATHGHRGAGGGVPGRGY